MPLPTTEELESMGDRLLVQWGADELRGRWQVVYNERMRTRAGVAYFELRRIELNPRLLERNRAHVAPTLAHELAHLVVWARHGRRADAHGFEWTQLMETAGFDASVHHRMNVDTLRQRRRPFYYLHRCERCRSWWIARCLRRDRPCRRCGPGPIRVLRTERTARGLATLRDKARES